MQTLHLEIVLLIFLLIYIQISARILVLNLFSRRVRHVDMVITLGFLLLPSYLYRAEPLLVYNLITPVIVIIRFFGQLTLRFSVKHSLGSAFDLTFIFTREHMRQFCDSGYFHYKLKSTMKDIMRNLGNPEAVIAFSKKGTSILRTPIVTVMPIDSFGEPVYEIVFESEIRENVTAQDCRNFLAQFVLQNLGYDMPKSRLYYAYGGDSSRRTVKADIPMDQVTVDFSSIMFDSRHELLFDFGTWQSGSMNSDMQIKSVGIDIEINKTLG